MKKQDYTLIKIEADNGKVFDYANLLEHTIETIDPETGEKNIVVDHLYTKVIYLGITDSVDNYIEVDDPALEEDNNDIKNS